MDFVRLGLKGTTQYTPDLVIEGYNSLVWAERFFEPGTFELKSFDVDKLRMLLPVGTFVSHLDTYHVMRVEDHQINWVGQGDDLKPEVTITGRQAVVILESRWVEGKYQKKRKMRKKYKASSAAGVLIFNAVVNTSGKDVTRGDTDPEADNSQNDFPWTLKDALPNVEVTDSVAEEDELRWWQLSEGELLPQLVKILYNQDLGIRCLRPSPNVMTVLTVKTNLADRGDVVRTQVEASTKMQFDIYNGVDRSDTVKFSLLQGHVNNPTKLVSTKDERTVAEMMSGEISIGDVYLKDSDAQDLTGWDRKTMGFDAGTPEIPDEPEKPAELKKNATRAEREDRADAMDVWIDKHAKWKNKRANIIADFKEEQIKAARKELKARRRVNMFSGDISPLSPYVFKTHYELGDTVLLTDAYGEEQKMVVAEYVRSEDVNGDRGFPGLVEP